MAELYSFFNSFNGDRQYNASHLAKYWQDLVGNGVFGGGTALKVEANVYLDINVLVGKAWINGYKYWLEDTPKTITLATADSNLPRIDRVVIRLDLTEVNRKITAEVKTGTPNANPVAPELERNHAVWELGLADIRVNPNTQVITQSNITDLRFNANLCGVVSNLLESVDLTTIFNQYMDKWEATEQFIDDNMREFQTGYNLYGVASGTGTYTTTINGFVLLEGVNVKIKFPTGATAQSTLNINGLGAKPIMRADGTALPIAAGRILNLIYDGSNFIASASMGVGTASPSDVLRGVSFTNDDGFQTGNMPENSTINTTLTTQNQTIAIPKGYYPNDGQVKATFANLIAGNIKSGVNIGGIVGSYMQPCTLTSPVVLRSNWQTGTYTKTLDYPAKICSVTFHYSTDSKALRKIFLFDLGIILGSSDGISITSISPITSGITQLHSESSFSVTMSTDRRKFTLKSTGSYDNRISCFY